jgi:iron(III) transport system permease protein
LNWPLLSNSLLVSATTALLSVAAGTLIALGLAIISPRLRIIGFAAVISTLALPPFLVLNSWLELFGASGLFRAWLPVPLYSLAGTILVLSSGLWPIATLLVLGAWDRVEPAQFESDLCLRGTALVRWVLWPAAGDALGLAAVLTFILAFNQFAIPVILQVPVFPEELWLALTARLNEGDAWVAAVPMILVPLLLLGMLRRRTVSWPRVTAPVASDHLARQLGKSWRLAAWLAVIVGLSASLLLPLGQLIGQSRTWRELPGLWKAAPDVILNSFGFAVAVATLATLIALRLRRWRHGGFFWLLFFVPGILLSQLLARLFGGTILYGTMAFVILTLLLHYAAIGWRAASDAEQALDRQAVEAGWLEGARGGTLFRIFVWPQLQRPVLVGWYVIYLLTLWDVETLVLIYPPGGDTLPLRIFQLLHYGHNSQVNAMGVTLLGLAVTPLLGWMLWQLLVGRRKGT